MEEQKQMTIEQLLEGMTAKMGREPETMVLLSKINESAVFEHVANQQFTMSGTQIPPKYKLLINLAASAAMGAEKCISNYTNMALKSGVSKEEIVEALLLARFVKASSVMSASTEALRMLANSNK